MWDFWDQLIGNNSPGLWKHYFVSLSNFSDNFISHVFVQLGNLKQLEFFPRTDRQTDKPNYRSSFPELKKGYLGIGYL